MAYFAPVILLTIVIFSVTVVQLAAKPHYQSMLVSVFVSVSAAVGLLLYGYIFACQSGSVFLGALRAALSVLYMFLGRNDYSAAMQTPLFNKYTGLQILFWVIHYMALYATAGTAIIAVGDKVLHRIRMLFVKKGDLILICGINPNSVMLGSQFDSRDSVIYIDSEPVAASLETIQGGGGLYRTDARITRRFLASVGAMRKNRKISVYCLRNDGVQNEEYAENILRAFEEAGISPQRTSLVMMAKEETQGASLQAYRDRYGYGRVFIFDEAQLCARILTELYPPYRAMTFNEDCAAESDFEALIVGFGRIGQAVLRSIVMNGQFAGSTFHAAVFSPVYNQEAGYMRQESAEMFRQYDIEFYNDDGRSDAMYRYLADHPGLKYIAVCTGNAKTNNEIGEEINGYLKRSGRSIPVYQCSYSGIRCISGKQAAQRQKLYDRNLLSVDKIDQRAIILNHGYCGNNGKTPQENWYDTDYFSRMSSRASADFAPAYLYMTHTDGKTAAKEGLVLTDRQKDNLGKTEHLRWNAFHFVSGYSPMPDDVFEKRAEIYRAQKAAGKSEIRIGKDQENRLHACLVSWEELDELSAKENRVTGGNTDYKEYDIRNVLAVPELLGKEADAS